jgi:hypothetical protein
VNKNRKVFRPPFCYKWSLKGMVLNRGPHGCAQFRQWISFTSAVHLCRAHVCHGSRVVQSMKWLRYGLDSGQSALHYQWDGGEICLSDTAIVSDRLRHSSSLPFKGQWGLFPWELSDRDYASTRRPRFIGAVLPILYLFMFIAIHTHPYNVILPLPSKSSV